MWHRSRFLGSFLQNFLLVIFLKITRKVFISNNTVKSLITYQQYRAIQFQRGHWTKLNQATQSLSFSKLTDVSACHLRSLVPVNVGKQSETKAFRIGRIRESVNGQGRLRGVERFSYSLVHLVVVDGAPVRRFTICYCLDI